MKITSSLVPLRAAFAAFLVATLALSAQEPPAPAPTDRAATPAATPQEPTNAPTPAPAAPDAPPAPPPDDAEKKKKDGERPLRDIGAPAAAVESEPPAERERDYRGGSGEFPFGDHHVPKGSRMRDAVSVFGSTTVEGEVDGDVVSVFGDSRIGPEAKASGAAVAVLGQLIVDGRIGDEAVGVLGGVKVNGRVGGEVVSVLGNLDLGPQAVIDGDVVVVGGRLKRDPGATVRGNIVNVPIFGGFGDLDWLVIWLKRCLLMGRPLAFGEGLGWAWSIALGFLAFYLLLALLFPKGIVKCATILETRPGYSILSSILTVFLTPVAIVLLAVTVIGVVLVPFVGAGLLGAKLFGKAVMLAWVGRRFTRFFGDGPLSHPVFAVLVGGLIVLLLYTVPVFGFLLYKLFTWLGLGVVIYTIALSMKRDKPAMATASATGAVAGGPSRARPTDLEPSMAAAGAVASTPVGAAVGSQPPVFSSEGAASAAGTANFAAMGSETFSPPPPVTSATPPLISAATMPRANFLIRMGALLIDVVLVGLLLGFMNGLLPRFLHPEPPSILLLLAIYGAVMWKLRGTTIGGIVCGLKVVRVDDRPIDWATAVVRALSCFLSLAVAGLGFIWVAIDDDKQSWHDKIAGTTVVRVPKGVSLL